MAPVLLVVLAIAGLAFAQDAARAAISAELGRLLGPSGGEFIKSILERSSDSDLGGNGDARRRRDGAGYAVRCVRRDAHRAEYDIPSQAE